MYKYIFIMSKVHFYNVQNDHELIGLFGEKSKMTIFVTINGQVVFVSKHQLKSCFSL